MPLTPGARFSRYEVISPLGAGEIGKVRHLEAILRATKKGADE
jgi:hypothetical protein